jgi:hypothetical protein
VFYQIHFATIKSFNKKNNNMKSDGIEVRKQRENGLTFSEEYDMIYEYNSQEESDYIYEEIFTRQIYLKHDIAIKENDTIIDCGANIGLFSLFCIKHVKNISILCIEPLPPNNTLLKRNLSDYMSKKNLDYNIKLCNCGVGRYEEECNFYFFPGTILISCVSLPLPLPLLL